MKVVMLPELTCQTGRFASFVTCSVSTYKSGKVVQTTGATSLIPSDHKKATLSGGFGFVVGYFFVICLGVTFTNQI